MRRAARLASAGLLAGTLLSGCVTVPQFYALEREVGELKNRQAGGGAAGDERVAELGAQVDALHDEIARLKGSLEEVRHLAEEARKQAEAASTRPQGEAPPAAAPGASVDPQTLSGEVRGYEEAFAIYRAGDYEAAVDRFKAFLQTYPSSAHADNALFWMGESYFRLEDYERAVLTFEDVVNRFPNGNKVPDALFRQGIALQEIGKRSEERDTYSAAARQIFERITKEHPQSERAAEAQRQLEKLGQ